MKEAKFTKGLWTATQYGYEKWSINGNKGVEVCGAWHGPNAHLIAAAPDMYSEIEKDISHLARRINNCFHDDSMLPLLEQEMSRKIKLLAKARGEL